MPTKNQHEEKFQRNMIASDILIKNKPPMNEWVAVTAFYAVVHIIEKYFSEHPHLSTDDRDSDTHDERRTKLFRFINHGIIPNRNLRNKYRLLSNAAHVGRYKSMESFIRQYNHRIQDLVDAVEEFEIALS